MRVSVSVWYITKATWRVAIRGPAFMTPGWRTVEIATYKTRDAARAYAKVLRRALRKNS